MHRGDELMALATETAMFRIVSSRRRSSGKKRGQPWTLWELEVFDEDGQAPELPCFTFHRCKPNRRLREFEIERRDHPRYGASYTLTPVGAADDDDLLARVEHLEERVAALAAVLYDEKQVIA
jgi:hypothetical protein